MAVAVSVATVGSEAQAQDDEDREQARVLFLQGLEAAQRGDHLQATEAFRSSYDAVPRPAALMNLALYLQELGRDVEAHASWSELVDRFGGVISEEARARARGRLAVLEGQLVQITLTSSPEGATLVVDERPVGQSPLDQSVVLLPGPHTFEASLSGYATTTLTRSFGAGEQPELELDLEILEIAPDAPQVQEDEEAPVSPSPEVALSGLPDHVVDPAGERGHRPFWSSPWPWVLGSAILVAAAVTVLAVLLTPTEEPLDWEATFR